MPCFVTIYSSGSSPDRVHPRAVSAQALEHPLVVDPASGMESPRTPNPKGPGKRPRPSTESMDDDQLAALNTDSARKELMRQEQLELKRRELKAQTMTTDGISPSTAKK